MKVKAKRLRAHIFATNVVQTHELGAVGTAPANVAVAGALEAVAPPAAVVQLLPHARQHPWVRAHELVVRTLMHNCTALTQPVGV